MVLQDFRMRRSKTVSATAAQSPTRTLPSEVDKLFFICFKNNPLQLVVQPPDIKARKWIKVLMPVMETAIKELHYSQPETKSACSASAPGATSMKRSTLIPSYRAWIMMTFRQAKTAYGEELRCATSSLSTF